VSRLSSVVDKARGVLRRVHSINENLQKVANEKFKKVGDSAGGSCSLHSFVAATLVLMADGSTKPIAEVDIGDKVKATDPTTGDTTDRDVVATIVHDDEGDMTRLTVASEDGTTGTVDATSWHPVWVDAEGRFVNIGDLKPGQHLTSADGSVPTVTDVDRYTHFEPVYDLTVDGVHTYYVVVGSASTLVHNCGTGDARFEVDSDGVVQDLDQNPLEGTTYTDKVLNQIETGDDHGFPLTIDQLPTMRDTSTAKGGDGVPRLHVKLQGQIGKSRGTFHWIVESDKTVNHRFFDRRMK
jgi:hypothetical protein